MKQATFVTEINVIDPETLAPVHISIYKHENGGMFGIDSSYIEQGLDDEDELGSFPIADPFADLDGKTKCVMLNDSDI